MSLLWRIISSKEFFVYDVRLRRFIVIEGRLVVVGFDLGEEDGN